MSDVIGIGIEKWEAKHVVDVRNWLRSLYGPSHYTTWYIDVQPYGCEDLVMRKDIYFMFVAAFGENNGSTS